MYWRIGCWIPAALAILHSRVAVQDSSSVLPCVNLNCLPSLEITKTEVKRRVEAACVIKHKLPRKKSHPSFFHGYFKSELKALERCHWKS